MNKISTRDSYLYAIARVKYFSPLALLFVLYCIRMIQRRVTGMTNIFGGDMDNSISYR